MKYYRVHYWEVFETFAGSGQFREGPACGNRLASYFAQKSVREVTCTNCREYVRMFKIRLLHPKTPKEP